MQSARGTISLNLAHFFDHYVLLIFPTVVLALEREWGGGYGALLSLGTWAFAAFALATVPAGWLGDRWSRPGMMRIFWLGTGASCALAGLVPDAAWLAVALTALGAFAAIYHPVATALVYAASERSGRALAVNGVFGNLGIAAAALGSGLIAEGLGWRAAFLIPGLIMLGLGLLPQPSAATERSGAPLAAAADRGTQRRVLAVLAATALLGGLIFNGTTIALPKMMAERLDGWTRSLGTVGALTALVFAVAAFAQLPVGAWLDRVGARRLLLVIEAVKTPLLLLLALSGGAASAALALPLMLLVFGEIPITAWLLGRYVTPAWRSRAYAAQFLLSLGVGAATVPLIAGLHDATGDSAALLLVLAAASAIVLLAALLLPARPAAGLRRSAETIDAALAPARRQP